VAAPPPFSASEEAFLAALVEEDVPFLVVGLAAAALQGAPAVTQDIDLWFADLADPRFRAALRKAGVAYVAPGPNNPPLLAGAGADLFDIVQRPDGLDSFDKEAKRAVRVRLGGVDVPVLPLERIIKNKKAAGRPKDRAILPVLEDTLRVLRSRSAPRRKKSSGKKKN
jgi:hypothetical protein